MAFEFIDDASVWLETEAENRSVEAAFDRVFESLVHLVRNAVDHGIGSKGRITVRVGLGNLGYVFFEVRDNGQGIDAQSIRDRAIAVDVLDPNVKLTDLETIGFIFHPGFSTKTEITEISGRGVGLAVVKQQAESLGGRVEVETEKGNGTVFRLVLPIEQSFSESRHAA